MIIKVFLKTKTATRSLLLGRGLMFIIMKYTVGSKICHLSNFLASLATKTCHLSILLNPWLVNDAYLTGANDGKMPKKSHPKNDAKVI